MKLCLKEAKDTYRRKVENKLRDNNMKEVWQGVNTIIGHRTKAGGTVEEANEMNAFFNRFNQPTTPPPSPSPNSHLPPPSVCLPLNISSTSPPSPWPSPCITADQVRGQLRKIRHRKAAGPDKVCPQMLKSCAAQLGEPLQHIFNLSLQLRTVPTLWKTSCIVPVPKKTRPSELNDYRPVALTSHLMKTLERLLLHLIRSQVQHVQDPLQFAYRAKVGVEDTVLFLLHRAHSHLDRGSGTVRILFIDFSSAFNTIQPPLQRRKLVKMGVDSGLVDWISSYLSDRPQYVRLNDITSDTDQQHRGPSGNSAGPSTLHLIHLGLLPQLGAVPHPEVCG